MDQELEQRLRVLLDRQEIYDRLMRYARGIDRNDGALVEDTFWPDALVDHGHSKFRGEDIGASFGDVSRTLSRGQIHYICNIVMEVHGDEAITEAQCIYVAETARNNVPWIVNRAVRYIDRWEKRDGEWRVFHRVVPETFNRIDPVIEKYPPHPGIIHAGLDKTDISYEMFERARTGARPSLDLPDNDANTEHAAHRLDDVGFRSPLRND